jgi:hypothetical protein
MLRRTLALATLATLSGCATYEVAERGSYYEVRDGSYYAPARGGHGDYYTDPYPREDVRYYSADPYDRYFYGYRDYGPSRYWHPYYDRGGWFGSVTYSNGWGGPGWSRSRYGWSSGWGWSTGPGYGYGSWSRSGYGYSPWGWGYSDPYYNYYPHYSRPINRYPSQPSEPRPMPKPTSRVIGNGNTLPVYSGPSMGGEAIRGGALPRTGDEGRVDNEPVMLDPREVRSMPKPQPRFEEPRVEEPRFEEPQEAPRYEEPRFERPRYEEPQDAPRYEEPRFERPEPREEPRFEQPRYEEPRFERPEPREEPRFEQPRYEEPRFEQPEPREEPRFEQPRYEEPRFERPEPREEPRFEQPRYEEPRFERPEPREEPRFEMPEPRAPEPEPERSEEF